MTFSLLLLPSSSCLKYDFLPFAMFDVGMKWKFQGGQE